MSSDVSAGVAKVLLEEDVQLSMSSEPLEEERTTAAGIGKVNAMVEELASDERVGSELEGLHEDVS